MANDYKKAIQEAEVQIDGLKGKLDLLHQSILNNAKEFKTIFSNGGTDMKVVKEQLALVQKQMAILNAEKRVAINTEKELQSKIKTKNDLLRLEHAEIKKNITVKKEEERQTKLQAQALEKQQKETAKQTARNTELSRAYVKLVNEQKKAKKILQDLIVTQGRNTKETKQAQAQYDKLTAKVNQANKATSNFSNGGLGGAVRGFKNLLGAFGVIGGIQLFADFTRKGFDLARQLDSLNFTMRAVIENEEVLSRTQLFLSSTAEKYGASILTLTERYNKFYTAARQSGVTLEDTEDIFKSFTKSAGFLGLRSHELEGVFLALEQMLSKGKVTTEELRRQLGERLPGAFGVMAQTVQKLNPDIEVTVATLDKMLRAGTILSAEVLPEFARQYEKSIGIEQKERVETLNASIERMTNSWVSFIGSITNSDGVISKVLINGITLVTSFIESLNLLNQTQEKFNKVLENKAFLNQTKYYKELGKEAIAYAKIDKKNREEEIARIEKQIKFNEELVKLYSTDYPKYYKLSREHNKDTTKARQENESLNNALNTQLGLLKSANNVLNQSSEIVEEETSSRRTLGVVLKEISALQGQLKESTKEESREILNKISALNQEKRAWELIKQTRDKVEAMDIKPIGMNGELSKYQKELIAVLETAKSIEEVAEIMPLSKETLDRLKEYNKTLVETKDKAEQLEALKGIFGEVTDTFSDMFDIDISKFDFLFDSVKNTVEDWAELSKELIGSVLDASLQRYDIELQTAQRTRDEILNNDLASDEAKENARKKFDEEERRIKTEKAKQERENALIKIAVDTAVGIAKAVAFYASNPITAIGLPAVIALIAGAGALQAGIVASQPLPQFFDGVENSSYEGLATKDERGAEIQLDKHGNIKDLGQNKGAKYTYVEKGDTIIPAMQTKSILDNFNVDNMQSVIFDMNMFSNGQLLKQNEVDNSLLREVISLKASNEKIWGEVKKLASRKINVNNKIELKDERAY